MPTFIIQIAIALLGMTYMAGASSADSSEILPGDNVPCYHKQTTCTYEGGGYWTGCPVDGSPEWLLTGAAKLMCDVYHAR